MAALSIIFLLIALLSSCPSGDARLYDTFLGLEKSLPKLTSYELRGNMSVLLSFDRPVEAKSIKALGLEYTASFRGEKISIPLPRRLKRGEDAGFSLIAEDEWGNTSHFILPVFGKNDEIPTMLINELSIKGTKESPDRIELLALDRGNIAGMVVTDGKHSYTLPDIDVGTGDIILIYWNTKAPENLSFSRHPYSTHVLDASSPSTLSGTSGTLVLYRDHDGKIEDALIYADGEEGIKSEETEQRAKEIEDEGEWDGGYLDSRNVTASRVFARYPALFDRNIKEDFFITKARASTFGYVNEIAEYVE
ncbi:MAG: hypothetical protein SPJ34_09900 [Candidatus Ornithospirochaeta sp.]|nr:hypothetical protein [Candidatus Ornithospirochaeta sp.]